MQGTFYCYVHCMLYNYKRLAFVMHFVRSAGYLELIDSCLHGFFLFGTVYLDTVGAHVNFLRRVQRQRPLQA